jgi:hypothetical protein
MEDRVEAGNQVVQAAPSERLTIVLYQREALKSHVRGGVTFDPTWTFR